MMALTLGTGLSAIASGPYPWPINYTQPDGSQMEVRMQGNEYDHYYLTADGQTLQADAEGWLRPAQRKAPGPRKGNGSHTNYVVRSGSPRVCVILVQFSDVQFHVSDPQSYYYNFLNQEGFSENGSVGSVKDYFKEQSNGKYTPIFDVYGPVTLGTRSTYAATSNAYKMVWEGAAGVDTSSIDFSQYDQDGDGSIDHVCIIYAGRGANYGESNAPWPHNSTCPTSLLSYKKVDGKYLNHYHIAPEDGYYAGTAIGIGNFVHEFGHALGLPDLYDTNSANAYTPNLWDVMDTGYFGSYPVGYSIHEKMAMDWMTINTNITYLTEAANVTLAPVQTHNMGYCIETGRSGDYYLLEYRTKTGFDQALPNNGMLIWHIDNSVPSTLQNSPNNTQNHLCVDLVRADNSTDTDAGDCWPGSAGKTAFTSTSSPAMTRWSDATSATRVAIDKPITDIAITGTTLATNRVTFKFMGGSDSNIVSPDNAATTYKVAVNDASKGSAYIDTNGITEKSVYPGTTVTFYAVAATGCTFSGWQHNGKWVGFETSLSVTATGDNWGTWTAVFKGEDPWCCPDGVGNTTKGKHCMTQLWYASDGIETVRLRSSFYDSAHNLYYSDFTQTVEVDAGATINFGYMGTMYDLHPYIYVDWENNGFDYSQWSDYLNSDYSIKEGSELMFYSRWSPNGGTNWYSSKDSNVTSGDWSSSSWNGSFTVPETTPSGTYRLRFKAHYNSLDPCGGLDYNTDSSNTLANWAGQIADCYLKVNAKATGLDALGLDEPEVRSLGLRLNISTPKDAPLRVTDLQGRVILAGTAPAGTNTYALPAPGIYLVKVGGKSWKTLAR